MTKPRMTIQRRKILACLEGISAHATTEKVYDLLHAGMPDLSLSTVYRNLKSLAQQGLVSVSDLDGKLVYETIGARPHHHLVCLSCHRTFDLDNDLVAALFQQIEQTGFKVTTSHMVLYGLCRDCQRAQGG